MTATLRPHVPRPGVTSAQIVLAATIRALCDRSRITQAALAAETGISTKHLSQMLSGANRGSLQAWERLTDAALRLTPTDGVLDVAVPTADLRNAAGGR
jgi:transcriptional regulator with XRE-family HTH domain